VVPVAPLIGNNFILMDDNARPHIARVVNEFLDEVGINRIEWPPRSPDLNPIEHVWDMIGKKVRPQPP
jgi:transposase